MKNIHVLPTDKPSNLVLIKNNLFLTTTKDFDSTVVKFQNIYITNDDEIKDYYYLPRTNSVHKCIENPTELNLERRLGVAKIILTTDQNLIKDGVQAIDDDFLEWFVKNPTCEEIETKLVEFEVDMELGESCIEYGSYYKIILPQEKQKQHLIDIMKADEELGLYEENKKETLEEAAEKYADFSNDYVPLSFGDKFNETTKKDFINGAKWQQERSYSEEEVKRIIDKTLIEYSDFVLADIPHWFIQFKKKK